VTNWIQRFLLLVVLGSASGCCRPGQGTVPTPIDFAFVGVLVARFVKKKGLRIKDRQKPDDRHKAFFVARRAYTLGLENESWRNEPDLHSLEERIESEYQKVDSFTVERIGSETARGPYFGGTDPSDYPHLDLARASVPRIDPPGGEPSTTVADAIAATNPTELQGRVLEAVDRRRAQVMSIIWRAAGIHKEFWENTSGPTSSVLLRETELAEILDRRLRLVEQTRYNLSAGAAEGEWGYKAVKGRRWILGPFNDDGGWESRTPGSGYLEDWKDHYTGRAVELPELPATPFFFRAFNPEPNPPGTGDPSPNISEDERFADPKPWRHDNQRDLIEYNLPPGTRMLQRLDWRDGAIDVGAFWHRGQEGIPVSPTDKLEYAWTMNTNIPQPFHPADVILYMMSGSWQYKERSWLYSDGAFSLAQLEALMLAKWRRVGRTFTGRELQTTYSLSLDDYFQLRPQPFLPVTNGIMRGSNSYFENLQVLADNLQVGDQLLFRNHAIHIAAGVLEDVPTAIVTSIDSDAKSGVVLSRLRVQPFCGADQSYLAYQQLFADQTDRALDDLRAFIVAQLSAHPGTDILLWDTGRADPEDDMEGTSGFDNKAALRRWSPYGQAFNAPGPWWFRINIDAPIWGKMFGDTLEEAVLRVPKSVARPDASHVIAADARRKGVVRNFNTVAGFVEPPHERSGMGPPIPANRVIYFPLYEPKLWEVGWTTLFEHKAASISIEAWPDLHPLRVDSMLAASLTFGATDNGIRVIRPSVRAGT
jgi:hypothetical protein